MRQRLGTAERRAQRNTPYLQALCDYAARAPARLHVPGHKGGDGADPGLLQAIGRSALELDIPALTYGIDVCPSPTPFEQAQRLAARAWGRRPDAQVHGPMALLLLDAHADTWEDYYGEKLFHGTVFKRATEEGLIDPERSVMAGIRGSLYSSDDLDQARSVGFELIGIDALRRLTPSAFADHVRARAGGAPVFLGFDIDVIDPSAAPGTGTPEVGGLSSAEALDLLRAMRRVRFSGFDVVEVSPPYDSPGQITALLAATIAFEMLALAALCRDRDGSAG
jgi:Arginase family/Orn/Lys/Arg decarboxylase, major domain